MCPDDKVCETRPCSHEAVREKVARALWNEHRGTVGVPWEEAVWNRKRFLRLADAAIEVINAEREDWRFRAEAAEARCLELAAEFEGEARSSGPAAQDRYSLEQQRADSDLLAARSPQDEDHECPMCGGDGAQMGDYGARSDGWCDSCEGTGRLRERLNDAR